MAEKDIFTQSDELHISEKQNKEKDKDEIKVSVSPDTSSTPTAISSSKPKFEFNMISISLCIVVIILICVIIWLIVKKPKVNDELLTKTQKLYQEAKDKNKELTDALNNYEKKNKVLESTNEGIMKNNSALKNQLSDIQEKYKSVESELSDYKTREAQAFEIENTPKSQSLKQKKEELYNKINPPKEVDKKVEVIPETEPNTWNMNMENQSIAAAKLNAEEEMANNIATNSIAASASQSDLDNLINAIN